MPQDRVLVVLVVIAVRSIQPSDGRSMAICCAMWRGMYTVTDYKIYIAGIFCTRLTIFSSKFLYYCIGKKEEHEKIYSFLRIKYLFTILWSKVAEYSIQYSICITRLNP